MGSDLEPSSHFRKSNFVNSTFGSKKSSEIRDDFLLPKSLKVVHRASSPKNPETLLYCQNQCRRPRLMIYPVELQCYFEEKTSSGNCRRFLPTFVADLHSRYTASTS